MGIGTSNAKRIPAALLAAIMLLPVTACNKQDDPTVNTSTETTAESTAITYTFGFTDEPEENESEYIVDNEDKAQKVITLSCLKTERSQYSIRIPAISADASSGRETMQYSTSG